MLTLKFPKSALGAIVEVTVEATVDAAEHLSATARPLPLPVQIRMLVDTGCEQSAIDEGCISHMGLVYVSAGFMRTMTGTKPTRSYELQLQLSTADAPSPWVVGPVVLSARQDSFDGVPYSGLIGRDILDRAVFTYDGPGHTCTLEVRPP